MTSRRRFIWYDHRLDDVVEETVLPNSVTNITAYKVIDADLRRKIIGFVQRQVCRLEKVNLNQFPGSLPITLTEAQVNDFVFGDRLWGEKIKGTHFRIVGLTLCSPVPLLAREHSSQDIPMYQQPVSVAQLKYNKSTKRIRKQKLLQQELEEALKAQGSVTNETKPTYPMRYHSMQKVIALVDRRNEIYVIKDWEFQSSIFPFVGSGELAYNRVEKRDDFLIFNISMLNGFRLSHFLYNDRVSLYTTMVKSKFRCIPDSQFLVLAKPQDFFQHYDQVYARAINGPYECDGVVGTDNIHPAVEIGTDPHSCKFKDLHTFDFGIRLSGANITLLKKGRGEDGSITSKVPHKVQNSDLFFQNYLKSAGPLPVDYDKKIWECWWDVEKDEYYALDWRREKDEPNHEMIVRYTQQNCREALTPKYILDCVWERECRLQHMKRLIVARDSMSQQHSDYGLNNNRTSGYVDWLMKDSNFRPNVISNSDLVHEVSDIEHLSWQRATPSLSACTLLSQTIASDHELPCWDRLLDITGLKPVPKSRKRIRQEKEQKALNNILSILRKKAATMNKRTTMKKSKAQEYDNEEEDDEESSEEEDESAESEESSEDDDEEVDDTEDVDEEGEAEEEEEDAGDEEPQEEEEDDEEEEEESEEEEEDGEEEEEDGEEEDEEEGDDDDGGDDSDEEETPRRRAKKA